MLAEIKGGERTTNDLVELSLSELIDLVKDRQVEITATFEPERTEVTIQPWRPYTPVCPYGARVEGN